MSDDLRHALIEYHDAADEFGPRMPIVSGGVWDQPARAWVIWRSIRAAYGFAKSGGKKTEDRTAKHLAMVRGG